MGSYEGGLISSTPHHKDKNESTALGRPIASNGGAGAGLNRVYWY